ncbi:MAG: 4,5-DOPA dioxygenase extradiol [Oligoflexales bacterium]|nr:4,5-DOPA dioxygenase extradiol [Oligoflexales bacterium]
MTNKKRMPLLFVGHGSPMNALAANKFTQTLKTLGESIERPSSILCISAHWRTEGTWVTAMEQPKTIHDFFGFPKSLFKMQYPAKGSPELAELVCDVVKVAAVQKDQNLWGLDHGTWSVLHHMYPKADIPVVQLSLFMKKPGDYHFQIGENLKALRDRSVLIVGSGNIVHNLNNMTWEPDAEPFDWALEFDEWCKQKMMDRDYSALTHQFLDSQAGVLSVPKPDHYYPLLYVLGASDKTDELSFVYEGLEHGSLSMRAVLLSGEPAGQFP